MKKIFVFTIFVMLVFLAAYLVVLKKSRTKDEDEKIFTEIYETKEWHNGGGVGSGAGSYPINAVVYLDILQDYFNDPKYETIYDLGCGDWQLMERISIPQSKVYKGFDLVESVINRNKQKYQKNNVNFYHIHKLGDFEDEKGDLIIVKDVLAHWSNERIQYFIEHILPNFKYALLTIDYSIDGVKNVDNKDKDVGHHRAIDLYSAPFLMKNIEVVKDYQAEKGIIKRIYLYTNPKY